MASPVEEIKQRLSIVEVVGSYLKLEKAGSNFKARCPFHTEKTPSFFVSPSRGTFYCFGCGAKGDHFSFVEQFEGLDFPGALRMLAARAGVTLSREDRAARTERDRLRDLLEAAASFFEAELEKVPAARGYLRGRGLSDDTVRAFRLGFAPASWRGATEHLLGKGFSEEEIERGGVAKRGEGKLYDRFRGRIMFPLFDSAGRVIAFSGRIFGEDEGGGKYINSPETPLFEKSKVLYGFDRAKYVIRKVNFAILVEGQMDLLMAHQAGFPNAVALSGTALSEAHLDLLGRLSGNLVLALDADEAGIRSAGRSALAALARGMDVKVARLPDGEDPADLIARDKDAWRAAIRGAEHIVDFMLAVLSRKGYDTRTFGLKVRSVALPYVAAMGNRIDREHFVRKVAGRLGIPEEAVREELLKIPGENAALAERTEAPRRRESRERAVARRVAGFVLAEGGRSDASLDVAPVRERFLKVAGEEGKHLLAAAGPEREALLFEAEAAFAGVKHPERDVEELLDELEETKTRELLKATLAELKKAEAAGEEGRTAALLAESDSLSQLLGEISRRRAARA